MVRFSISVSVFVLVLSMVFMQLSAEAQVGESAPVAGKITAVCNLYCVQVDSAGEASLVKDFDNCPSGTIIAIDTTAKVCYLVGGSKEKMAGISKMPSKKAVKLTGELKGGQDAWILYVD